MLGRRTLVGRPAARPSISASPLQTRPNDRHAARPGRRTCPLLAETCDNRLAWLVARAANGKSRPCRDVAGYAVAATVIICNRVFLSASCGVDLSLLAVVILCDRVCLSVFGCVYSNLCVCCCCCGACLFVTGSDLLSMWVHLGVMGGGCKPEYETVCSKPAALM